MTKNKTLATWLTFLGGPFGLHRFYLFSFTDRLGWILPIPTLLGLYGVQRAREHGLDDPLGWLLIPLLGFTMAGCAINAIVYGLMASPAWNARFNPHTPPEHSAGHTNWFTIGAVVLALLVGATVLISSIAFSFQHYFEYQIEESRKLSQ
jgi:hypothetical protein